MEQAYALRATKLTDLHDAIYAAVLAGDHVDERLSAIRESIRHTLGLDGDPITAPQLVTGWLMSDRGWIPVTAQGPWRHVDAETTWHYGSTPEECQARGARIERHAYANLLHDAQRLAQALAAKNEPYAWDPFAEV